MTVGLTPYQLRFCPASYLHEAHLPSSWAQVPELLPEWRTLPASHGALLEARALGIGYEMPAPLGGLALFPQSELVLLLRRLGAVLHGEAIRICLQAPTLRQIIAQQQKVKPGDSRSFLALDEELHRTLALHAGRELVLDAAGQLSNQHGTLEAQRLEIDAERLLNDGGIELSSVRLHDDMNP